MDDANLLNEIKELETSLQQKKTQLFYNRFIQLLELTDDEIKSMGVSNIVINTDAKYWSISYTHTTNQYSENNYLHEIDSEMEIIPYPKITHIKYGFSANSYFIQGLDRNRFTIYTKGSNLVRIINKDYNIELDISDQLILMDDYSKNKDIPEWLIVLTVLQMNKHEWNGDDMCIYLSVI